VIFRPKINRKIPRQTPGCFWGKKRRTYQGQSLQ